MNLIQTTYKTKESAQFALGLLVKYIYSCLIDADRLDAYLFNANEQYEHFVTDWDNLIHTFEKNIQKLFEGSIQKFGAESKIVKIRQSVSSQCKEAAIKNTGIYHLSVPTGGGKTLSSLRFALNHCKVKNKKRIIYVIPYLSIIEQTASELRKILSLQENSDLILEHHSNIIPPDDEEWQEIRKLATSRWDKPIIITTMVQFLETAMSSKGSELRKFHNMSDSVIIFDEIQSLPIKSIHLFNETVSFLSKLCNSTILLCTATQPLLDKTERANLLLENNPSLVDCDKAFEDIKRTHILPIEEKDVDGFAAFISGKADICGNCLTIVNTKKSAREVFDKLKNKNGFLIYHLSTSMCPAHRNEVIAKIIKIRKETPDEKIICISTQLVEAGIDFSFSCVVRATAGLDSVAQAAGRCNRNGESENPQNVYVIPLKGENLDKLVDIKSGKEITERLVRENKNVDLLDPTIMREFYRYYFYVRKDLMDYPTNDGGTIYDMLSFNNMGLGNYKNRTGSNYNCIIAHAFRTADENFYVIDKNAESVVVLYDSAEKLIEIYNKQPKDRITKEKLDIIKKLQKYSVSLYSYEMENLASAISILDEEIGIKILNRIHYSEYVGVVFETTPKIYIV